MRTISFIPGVQKNTPARKINKISLEGPSSNFFLARNQRPNYFPGYGRSLVLKLVNLALFEANCKKHWWLKGHKIF